MIDEADVRPLEGEIDALCLGYGFGMSCGLLLN